VKVIGTANSPICLKKATWILFPQWKKYKIPCKKTSTNICFPDKGISPITEWGYLNEKFNGADGWKDREGYRFFDPLKVIDTNGKIITDNSQ